MLKQVNINYDKRLNSKVKEPVIFYCKVLSNNFPIFNNFGKVTELCELKKSCLRFFNLGICITNYSFKTNTYTHRIKLKYRLLNNIAQTLLNIKNKEEEDINDCFQSFEILFHELYHTKNKMDYSFLEEALTEFNCILSFTHLFKELTGEHINLKELTINHFKSSYRDNINVLINFFEYLKIEEGEMLDIIFKFKNSEVSFNNKKNEAFKKDMAKVGNMLYFIILFNKYFKRGSIKKFPSITYVKGFETYFIDQEKTRKKDSLLLLEKPQIINSLLSLEEPEYKTKEKFEKYLFDLILNNQYSNN